MLNQLNQSNSAWVRENNLFYQWTNKCIRAGCVTISYYCWFAVKCTELNLEVEKRDRIKVMGDW